MYGFVSFLMIAMYLSFALEVKNEWWRTSRYKGTQLLQLFAGILQEYDVVHSKVPIPMAVRSKA